MPIFRFEFEDETIDSFFLPDWGKAFQVPCEDAMIKLLDTYMAYHLVDLHKPLDVFIDDKPEHELEALRILKNTLTALQTKVKACLSPVGREATRL